MRKYHVSLYILYCLFIILTVNSRIVPQGIREVEYGTSSAQRSAYRDYLQNKIIKYPLSSPLGKNSENNWKSAWWAAELTGFKDSLVLSSIRTALSNAELFNADFIRASLEAAYALYDNELENEIASLIKNTCDRKIFAISALYIIRSGRMNETARKNIIELMAGRFPGYEKDPVLTQLYSDLNESPLQLPPVGDLIRNVKWKNELVLFCFQRKNRNYEGLTIIKDTSGNLVLDKTGRPVSIRHLARSLSNLPGYITNGNTPEGIFAFSALSSSKNQFIGKTPLIETAMPYEIPVNTFFRNNAFSGLEWSPELILNILPESWKNFPSIMESYYAGKAGRSEIVMHGTTIDPSYYIDMPFYPNTPSLGCITAREIFDPADGSLTYSDQARLIDAVLSAGGDKGYLVVLNLDDKTAPVELEEILRLINK